MKNKNWHLIQDIEPKGIPVMMKENPRMTAVQQARGNQPKLKQISRLMTNVSKKKLTEYLICWNVWKGEFRMKQTGGENSAREEDNQ